MRPFMYSKYSRLRDCIYHELTFITVHMSNIPVDNIFTPTPLGITIVLHCQLLLIFGASVLFDTIRLHHNSFYVLSQVASFFKDKVVPTPAGF